MIIVALGSNMDGPWGSPDAAIRRALTELNGNGMTCVAASRLLTTAPFGRENQPPYVNAVAVVATLAPPLALLSKLHAIEKAAGRRRQARWGPRTLDLDIIDYHSLVEEGPRLTLPHPGIAERVFVLKPIAEIAPTWRHPVTRLTAADMLRRLSNNAPGGEI